MLAHKDLNWQLVCQFIQSLNITEEFENHAQKKIVMLNVHKDDQGDSLKTTTIDNDGQSRMKYFTE